MEFLVVEMLTSVYNFGFDVFDDAKIYGLIGLIIFYIAGELFLHDQIWNTRFNVRW